MRITQMLPIS